MKTTNSFAKQRYSDELQLLRSNMEILPFTNQHQLQSHLSTPKIQSTVGRSRSRIPHPLSYQNLLTFSFEKQNYKKLSFSNLKKSLKSQLSSRMCGVHPLKIAKYKQSDSNRFYCKQCAIQVASKGIKVQDIMLTSASSDLQKLIDQCSLTISETNQIIGRQFGRVKSTINLEIQAINEYYTAITEKISEMQIKDLLVFETCLENAERQFSIALSEIALSNQEITSIPKSISEQELSMVCKVINSKMQNIANIKFQVVKQDSGFKSKMENINANLQTLHLNLGNYHKSKNVISQILKSNSTFESQKNKKYTKITESVQDTPESLKKKLSVSGKSIVQFQQLKTIQFCESITDLPQMLAEQQQRMQETPKISDGPRHRYGQDLDYDE